LSGVSRTNKIEELKMHSSNHTPNHSFGYRQHFSIDPVIIKVSICQTLICD